MQVILLQDVANVGKKFQEVEVADGYGTNFLIPKGFAQVATDETRARYKAQQEAAEAARREEREKLAQAVGKIDGASVTITVQNAGDQGQLFAGIYPKDIAAALNEEFDIDITSVDIDRDQPISKVGEEEIDISILDTDVKVVVNVEAANHGVADPEEDDEVPSGSGEQSDEVPSDDEAGDSGEE